MLALAAIDTTELTTLDTFPRAASSDVLSRARLDWSVQKTPMYLPTGRVVPNHYAMVRSDSGATLGVVGNRYQPIQNASGLDLFDVAASHGLIEYGNAGMFKGGAIVWLQAKLPEPIVIAGQEVAKYLLLANSHDGSGTLRVLLTPIRIICRNTLAMALRADAGMTIRHTASADAKMQTAQRAIEAAGGAYAQFEDVAQTLYRRSMTSAGVRGYVDALLPAPIDSEPSARLEGTRAKIIDLFDSGDGHYAIRGTAWAAYNAVAQYTDHARATRGSDDNRLESAWLGSGAALKRRALDLALSL
jgi:phage/plasmid-like protein (TIGR03299 family)